MGLLSKKNKPSQKAYAVVTGAGSGIGRSFALELAKRGGDVICADIDLSSAQETVDLIQSMTSTSAYAVHCDVGLKESVHALAEQAEQLLGHPVTLLINNAGVGLGSKFDEVSLEDWRWCMHVNLWGVIHGCHYFVPKFKQQGFGAIINVASINGRSPGAMQGIYSVTKAAVISMTQAFAKECAGLNIRVNALLPGLTDTKFASALTSNKMILDSVLSTIPLNRVAQPDEMAGAVLYLASSASSYTTGTTITVDGGFLS